MADYMDKYGGEPECAEAIDEIPTDSEPKEMSIFKQYYQNPEYRKRHLKYISEKVKCDACDSMVARCNMSKHKRTKKHKRIEEIQQEKFKKKDLMTSDMIAKIILKLVQRGEIE